MIGNELRDIASYERLTYVENIESIIELAVPFIKETALRTDERILKKGFKLI